MLEIDVFSSIACYYTVKFDVSKHNLDGSAAQSQCNVREYHSACKVVTLYMLL